MLVMVIYREGVDVGKQSVRISHKIKLLRYKKANCPTFSQKLGSCDT
jgi:hypothetical protein